MEFPPDTNPENPQNLALTSRQVMYEDWPILLVVRRADEGQWSFVNGWGDTDDTANAMSVHIDHVIERDPSLLPLADLPLGWRAWRETADHDWTREPDPDEITD